MIIFIVGVGFRSTVYDSATSDACLTCYSCTQNWGWHSTTTTLNVVSVSIKLTDLITIFMFAKANITDGHLK